MSVKINYSNMSEEQILDEIARIYGSPYFVRKNEKELATLFIEIDLFEYYTEFKNDFISNGYSTKFDLTGLLIEIFRKMHGTGTGDCINKLLKALITLINYNGRTETIIKDNVDNIINLYEFFGIYFRINNQKIEITGED